MKMLLCAAGALAFASGAALADNNAAWLQQKGNANAALITQGGDDNRAGRSTDGIINTSQAVTQTGDENDLSIVQSGNGNRAGTTAKGSAGQITQSGARNQIDLDQGGTNNQVTTIQQIAAGLAVLKATNSGTNALTIIQSSDDNLVGRVRQQQSNVANAAPNEMTITQAGGDGNTVTRAEQKAGHSNNMVLGLTGAGNRISLASQIGTGNAMDIDFIGDGNGTGLLTGSAATVGATVGVFRQGSTSSAPNSDNRQVFRVVGDRNQIGAEQFGIGNRMAEVLPGTGGIDIRGSDNGLGAVQTGTDNALFASVAGDLNTIGTAQDGARNALAITLFDVSNENDVRVEQVGDDNFADVQITGDFNASSLLQDGTDNRAEFRVTGNGNAITGLQDGTANRALVTQHGSFNTTTFSQIGGFNTVTVNQ